MSASRSPRWVVKVLVGLTVSVLVLAGVVAYLLISRSSARSYYTSQITTMGQQIKTLKGQIAQLHHDLGPLRDLVCASPGDTAERRRLLAEFDCPASSDPTGQRPSATSTPARSTPSTAAPTPGTDGPTGTASSRAPVTRTARPSPTTATRTVTASRPAPPSPTGLAGLLCGVLGPIFPTCP